MNLACRRLLSFGRRQLIDAAMVVLAALLFAARSHESVHRLSHESVHRLRGGSSIPRAIDKALVTDDVQAVQNALDKGKLDAEMVNAEGITALHTASRHGSAGALELLLDRGIGPVDVCRVSDGGTPLMYAAQNGHPDCLSLLLEAGAQVNVQQAEG